MRLSFPDSFLKKVFGHVAYLCVLSVIISIAILIVRLDGKSTAITLGLRYLALPTAMVLLGVYLALDKKVFDLVAKLQTLIGSRNSIISAICLYIILIFSLKVAKLNSLNYEFFDLGIYINLLYRIANADLIESLRLSLVEGHFQPVMLFFAGIYGITNSSVVPLGIETVILASGAIPVFMLAREIWSDARSALLLSFTYLMCPLVQFNDLLGFHPDHIVLPCLLWSFYSAHTGRFGMMTVFLLLVSCASEPWIPLASAFGIYFLLEHKKYLFGANIFLGFAILFFVVIFFLQPKFGAMNSGIALLDRGSPYAVTLSGGIEQLFDWVNNPRKLFFLFFIFFPFLFLSFPAWTVMIIAIPDLAKTMLSSEMLHFSVEGHYTLGLIAVTFVGYIYGVKKMSARYGKWIIDKVSVISFTVMIGFAVAHSPLPISFDFWTNWSGGAFNYKNYFESESGKSLREIERRVGADPDTKIEMTNNSFTSKLVRRNDMVHLFPSANWESADFVVIDKRGLYGSGAHATHEAYLLGFRQATYQLPEAGFTIDFEDNYFQLWKK